MSDYRISVIRTALPFVLGALFVTILSPLLSDDASREWLTFIVGMAWYGSFRYAEEKGSETAGYFLGHKTRPIYQVDTEILAQATSDGVFDYEEGDKSGV